MSIPRNPYRMQPAEPVESAEPVETWTRRKDESKRAWEAFVLFRDSPSRRLADVGKALIPPCSAANVARWSTRHNWQNRALDYDTYVDQQHLAEIARNRVSARARKIKIGQALQSLGAHALKEWQSRIEQGLPLNLSPETIALLSKAGAQLEADAMGRERGGAFTKINVILGHAPDDPEPNATDEQPPLIEGEIKKLKPN